MRRTRLLARLAALALLALPVRAGILVVDASGGGDFLDLQAAVDASVEGDTILVRAGTYAGFVATGKGLLVAAERGASVQVLGKVEEFRKLPPILPGGNP